MHRNLCVLFSPLLSFHPRYYAQGMAREQLTIRYTSDSLPPPHRSAEPSTGDTLHCMLQKVWYAPRQRSFAAPKKSRAEGGGVGGRCLHLSRQRHRKQEEDAIPPTRSRPSRLSSLRTLHCYRSNDSCIKQRLRCHCKVAADSLKIHVKKEAFM